MDIASALENIYINPLETCNLNCRVCYTHKTRQTLSNQQILSFVKRYQNFLKKYNSPYEGEMPNGQKGLTLKSIIFCGGEVFLLKNFPRLINRLVDQGIFITIITNGTIDRLTEIKKPHNCQLLVSFDGPKNIHDHNRGSGNFDKSNKFVEHALSLGFPVEIMYLVTPQSYPFIDSFSLHGLTNNYITQKTFFYTHNHPLARRSSNEGGPLSLPALTPAQIINIKKNYRSIPSKDFGCQQLSLQSNGLIYGCCESPKAISRLSTSISKTIKEFQKSYQVCLNCPLSKKNSDADNVFSNGFQHASIDPSEKKSLSNRTVLSCQGCCYPEFLCGYPKELGVKNCQQVFKKFNQTTT